MKKTIMLVVATLIAVTTFAQLQVEDAGVKTIIGKAKNAWVLMADLTQFIHANGDTVYVLSYKDARFPHLEEFKTISFTGGITTLNALYEVMVQAFDKPKGENTVFKLGDTRVFIQSEKSMGVKYSILMADDQSYVNLTPGQLKNLFGK